MGHRMGLGNRQEELRKLLQSPDTMTDTSPSDLPLGRSEGQINTGRGVEGWWNGQEQGRGDKHKTRDSGTLCQQFAN